MRFHNITHEDMLNGDGLRVVLWVAGCEHHCKGCQNPCTWDKNGGVPFGYAEMCELEAELSKDYISGITFSGGDPLATYNREEVYRIMKTFKTLYPDKTIWVYTGYTLEELVEQNFDMQYIDVLVDGKFVEELKDISYHWAGSTNQRVLRRQSDGSFLADEQQFGNYDKDRIISCPSCHN